jgi:hypothetical protein
VAETATTENGDPPASRTWPATPRRQGETAGTDADAREQPTETFDREDVQKLRDEAAGYRVRAHTPATP